EGDGYRVLVAAIVPSQDRDSRGLCAEGTGFKRVEFDDLVVKDGHELAVAKMQDAGLTPWVLRVGRQQ
ncbi:MAG TPA: hypothetical protein VFS23_20485, partial [Vicinamibacterales bacterium]|nr:hypothetical protein [Vicinamibacterales bacterium]